MLKTRKAKYIIAAVCAFVVLVTAIAGALGSASSCGFKNEAKEDYITDNGYSSSSSKSSGFSSSYDSYLETAESVGENSDMAVSRPYNKNDDITSQIIVRSANLSLETEKFDELMKSLGNKAEKLGGYTENQNESVSGAGNLKYGSITLRIPSKELESFINFAGDSATIVYKNVSADDITSNYIDTETKIKSLEAELDTLIGLMEKATNISETIEIQDRLTSVRSDLEYQKTMLKHMDADVSYSRVDIDLSEVNRTKTQGTGFFHEIKEGLFESFYEIGQGFRYLTIWFVTSLPFIAIIIVFAIITVKIVKFGVKRWKTKKSSASTSEETSQQ